MEKCKAELRMTKPITYQLKTAAEYVERKEKAVAHRREQKAAAEERDAAEERVAANEPVAVPSPDALP